jgi:ribonuclease T2
MWNGSRVILSLNLHLTFTLVLTLVLTRILLTTPDDETVRLGAGLVFSEVHKHAADRGKVIASGWASTVGVVGWHTGGGDDDSLIFLSLLLFMSLRPSPLSSGHGPFGTTHGLGVDNIVEVELVTANAELVTANATHNSDLFRGLRGGGGSIWGVITSLTVKAHAPPPQGYTQVIVSYAGLMCGDGEQKMNQFIGMFKSFIYITTFNNMFFPNCERWFNVMAADT